MDRISVLIVTYNYGRYLKQCIESVLAQTVDAELEILVVDDGSTDDTRAVAAEFPQVRYIHQEHLGVSAARNRAVAEATGEYLAFLDADDLWKPEKLELQLDYLKEHPDCPAVFTGYENFVQPPLTGQEDWVLRCISFARTDRSCLPTALFRRAAAEELGAFDGALSRGEDSDWTARMKEKGLAGGYLPQILYLRRLHGDNLMNRTARETAREIMGVNMRQVRARVRKDAERARFLPEGISVIIPVWNGEKFIKDCVESVLNQRDELGGVPLEVVVADDGSTDRTAQLAEQAGAVVYRLPHGGVSAARNAGLIRAKYACVFFLDSDDLLSPGALKALYNALSAQPELAAVFSHARDFSEQGVGRSYSGCLPGCALIRKEVFRKVGLFNENLQTGETVEWMVRFRGSGLPHALIERVTLERRVHESNTGVVLRRQEQQDYARILREHLKRKREQGGAQ